MNQRRVLTPAQPTQSWRYCRGVLHRFFLICVDSGFHVIFHITTLGSEFDWTMMWKKVISERSYDSLLDSPTSLHDIQTIRPSDVTRCRKDDLPRTGIRGAAVFQFHRYRKKTSFNSTYCLVYMCGWIDFGVTWYFACLVIYWQWEGLFAVEMRYSPSRCLRWRYVSACHRLHMRRAQQSTRLLSRHHQWWFDRRSKFRYGSLDQFCSLIIEFRYRQRVSNAAAKQISEGHKFDHLMLRQTSLT